MKQETTAMTRLRLSCLLLMVQEMWLVQFHFLVILSTNPSTIISTTKFTIFIHLLKQFPLSNQCAFEKYTTIVQREARNQENYLNTTQLIEKNISPRVLFIGINLKVSVLCRRSMFD